MSPSTTRKRSRSSTNTASDNAFVGVQGTVIGDVRYEVKDDDPPGKKFEVAKNCLAGKMPKQAKRLIEEVAESDFVQAGSTDPLVNEVAYYWAISVLSDKSFELLEKDEFEDLDRAAWLCRNGPADDWHNAHDAVAGLIGCLQDQERTGNFEPDELAAFFSEYDRLPTTYRDEIHRHLSTILSGAIKDRLDANFAESVRGQRTADDRDRRVWKFFEPVPASPRPKVLHMPDFGVFERTTAVCGAVMAVAGLILTSALLTLVSIPTVMINGAAILAAGSVVVYFGPPQFPMRYSALYPRRSRSEPTAFSDYIRRSVQQQFYKHAPTTFAQRSAWTVSTLRARTILVDEIVDLYSEPEVALGAVDWLIATYAQEAARKWSAHEVDDRWRLPKVLALMAAAASLIVGWLFALNEMIDVQAEITIVAAFWMAGGAGLLAWSRVDVVISRRLTHAIDKFEAERRFARENYAYQARCAVLADRPDDAEMAQWLDYDKFYLRTLAMNQYGLANRDVIAYAILPEAGVAARRARVTGGQPRFSAYLVWVFLLTASGVRQVAVNLDFPTGIASDQNRTAFRYDAIASARVTELGIRFDDGRREIIMPQSDDGNRRPSTSSLIFYQKFVLSLTDGWNMPITVENFDAALLDQQSDSQESSSTLDVSDLAGALGLLEAVAADGRKWIEHARIRHGYRPFKHDPDFPATDDIPAESASAGRRAPGDALHHLKVSQLESPNTTDSTAN